MRTTILAAVAVAAMTVAAGGAQATQLIQNGSFTQNTLPALGIEARTGLAWVGASVDNHSFSYGSLGTVNFNGAVTGWTSPNVPGYTNSYNLYFFDGATAKTGNALSRWPGEDQHPNVNFTGASPDGGAFMVLDADPGFSGPFQQTVGGLTVGQKYELSFYWAAGELSNRTGYESVQLTGKFGTDAFATATFLNSKPFYGPNGNQPGDFRPWEQVKYSFIADSTTQVLSFLAVGSPAGNLPPVAFLDGVSLTAVPEPGAWAIMLLGFAGLGGALRRRRALAA